MLPGILKILGQGGMAAYCIPSWDVLGIVCVTRDSQDTLTEDMVAYYTIPDVFVLAYGISKYSHRRLYPPRDIPRMACIIWNIPGCTQH